MEASKIDVAEKVPASRKLQEKDARALLKSVNRLVVAKGKKVSEYEVRGRASADAVSAMLGPTGNLRAPTIRTGKTLLVGFNEGAYTEAFR